MPSSNDPPLPQRTHSTLESPTWHHSLAGHFGATLGASYLIARLPRLVRHFVTTTGADAVAAWPGRLGTSHATRPTAAAASGTATTTSTLSTSHVIHLLPDSQIRMIVLKSHRGKLPPRNTSARWSAGAAGQASRARGLCSKERESLLNLLSATVGTLNFGRRREGTHQLLELFPALLTLVLIDWHQAHLTSLKD
jgi:hypothetical protein